MTEETKPDPKPEKKAAKKTYHTRIENSTFVYQPLDESGKPVIGQVEILQFRGDTLEVDNPAHILELDKIADKGSCPIYTKDPKAALVGANVPAAQVRERAAEVVEQIAKSGQRVS